jgi:hypothetical protein
MSLSHRAAHAKNCVLRIKLAKLNKRQPFACGKWGSFYVLIVNGRKQTDGFGHS